MLLSQPSRHTTILNSRATRSLFPSEPKTCRHRALRHPALDTTTTTTTTSDVNLFPVLPVFHFDCSSYSGDADRQGPNRTLDASRHSSSQNPIVYLKYLARRYRRYYKSYSFTNVDVDIHRFIDHQTRARAHARLRVAPPWPSQYIPSAFDSARFDKLGPNHSLLRTINSACLPSTSAVSPSV